MLDNGARLDFQLLLASTGKPAGTLAGHRDLTFDPSSYLLAVRSFRSESVELAVWDTLSSREKHVTDIDGGYRVSELACSTTGRIALVLDTSNDPVLHVWDFVAATKLVRPGDFHSLNFSTDANFLEINSGRIPVHDLHTDAEVMKKMIREFQDCLYVLDEWIYKGDKRLLWLQPAYRVSPSIHDINIKAKGNITALLNREILLGLFGSS
jgi:hypothetical protein